MNSNLLITSSANFLNWRTINDTIMGGSSQAFCNPNPSGLCLEGKLIEKDGGFVSCISPSFSSPLDLSSYRGIQIDIEGQGRTLKFAISCADNISRFTEFFYRGLKWVVELKTNLSGITSIKIPFETFQPNIRAKPILLPLTFSSSSITQFQLLCSKFGVSGNINPEFREGPFRIVLHSISAYF